MKYNELSEEGKQAALEEHREWNVEGLEWWDCTYEMFIEDMKEKGIEVDYNYRETMSGTRTIAEPCIYFSGFWSQGDGACFEGGIEDLPLFLKAHEIKNKSLEKLIELGGGINFSCRHTGHYYHENSVSFSYEAEDWKNLVDYGDDPDDFRHQTLSALIDDSEIEGFEETASEIFQDHMRQLYNDLEAEYDYQTSDEAIIESLEANEVDLEDCEPEEEEDEEPEIEQAIAC